jgi:hypothetical protein
MRNYLFEFLDTVADFVTGKKHGEFSMSKPNRMRDGERMRLIFFCAFVLGLIFAISLLLLGG